MITLKTEEVREVCRKILFALDPNGMYELTETVELVMDNGDLFFQITNREYFLKVKLSTGNSENFHATVKAELFLRLIDKTTSELITLDVQGNALVIKGNGTYKLPLVYEGTEMLTLPEIVIENVTNSFEIPGNVLNNIFTYNSKQFSMGNIVDPVQSMYYVDEEGAFTFTSGAIVNKFELAEPVKLLLNQKLVKLFKLFRLSEGVQFKIGQDALTPELIQTKVEFATPDIILTAILSMHESQLKRVPVGAGRNMAYAEYDHTVVIDKRELSQAITRLRLFIPNASLDVASTFGTFEFDGGKVTIRDKDNINTEEVLYDTTIPMTENYVTKLDFKDLSTILDTLPSGSINLSFGTHKSMVCSYNNVYILIPEIS